MREKKPQPLQTRLRALLQEHWRSGAFTQESLAKALGKEQTTIGQYLLEGKAGALDVDEADAALRHIGSTLKDFLCGIEPRPLTDAEKIGQLVDGRPGLRRVVELLLSVPKKRLDAVATLIQTVVLPAIGQSSRENDAFLAAPIQARRTTKARAKHR